ncbi:hypothetical protein BSLG_006394 [Batrachochytrium salamandrivorans]|nr:hypothetical protein BSLG_006394 [Batrachochytrium salamandrivorans]
MLAGRPKRGPWAYISPATDDRSSSSEFIQSRSSVAPLETGTTSTPTPTAAAASQSDTIMGTDCIYPPTLASQTDRLATPRLVPPPSSVVSQAMELDLSQDLYAHNNIVGFNTSTNMDDKYSDPVRPAHVPVPLLQDSNGGHMDHSRHKLPALTLYEYNPPLTVHHPKGVSEMQRLHHAHPASHILSKQPFPLLPLPLLKKSFMEPPNCHTDTSQHVHIPTHFIQPSVQRPIPTSFDQAFPHRPIPSHDFGRFRTTSVVSTFSSTPDTDDNDVGDRVEEEAVWIGSNRDDSSALCRSGNESVVDRSPLCEIELEASSFSLTKLDILSRLCDVVLADPRSVESPLLVPLLPHSGRTPISTQQHSALPPCHGSYSNSTAHDFEHSWVPNVHSVKPSYAELRPLYTEVVQHDTTKSLEKLHPCSTTPPATPISAGTTGASLPYILNVVTAESSDVSYPRPVLTWDTENHHQYLNAATTV